MLVRRGGIVIGCGLAETLERHASMDRHGSHRGLDLMIFGLGLWFVTVFPGCAPDHGLAPGIQGVRGTVYFSGAWPGDILEVRVAVFKTYPPGSFLDLSGYSDRIPLLSGSTPYEIELAAGEYAFVVVACRRTPYWDTDCLLGFYDVPGDPGTPAPVNVPSGRFADGVDICVDFGG
jgi:hypothetical protein